MSLDKEPNKVPQFINNLQTNFAFIPNIVAIKGKSELPLTKGHVLRKATIEEINKIKETLPKLADQNSLQKCQLYWECKSSRGQEPLSLEWVQLPPEDWGYHVLTFEGTHKTVDDLLQASLLSQIELDLGFMNFQSNSTTMYYPVRLSQFFQKTQSCFQCSHFFEIDENKTLEITTIYNQLQQHSYELLNLKPHLSQLQSLKELPHNSPLLFLGYFTLIESLLTHQPEKTDTIDSITRQIKKKLILLDRRWNTPIDYIPFNKDPEKVWGTMYNYRSSIAHGGKTDFQKEFKILKDAHSALILIKETVKKIMKYALIEPQLLIDLKNC